MRAAEEMQRKGLDAVVVEPLSSLYVLEGECDPISAAFEDQLPADDCMIKVSDKAPRTGIHVVAGGNGVDWKRIPTKRAGVEWAAGGISAQSEPRYKSIVCKVLWPFVISGPTYLHLVELMTVIADTCLGFDPGGPGQ